MALRTLHSNVRRVWRIGAWIAAGAFAAFAIVLIVLAVTSGARSIYVVAAVFGLIALAFVWSAVQFTGWRYAAWRYAVREHDVIANFGVFWRTRRTIPRLRIQHVDIDSGPIDRSFGLANVSLFTAGNITAVIRIPGVAPEEAERLRVLLLKLEPSDGSKPSPTASGQHAH
ncbi:MAG: PH domain-containing protein [Planctomycetes bacterium]|nr:PH domain-containing protein [Planctomycetota bacterium]